MIYDGYKTLEGYYILTGQKGNMYIPATQFILVDDESGLLAVKCVASRKTIALVRK